VQDGEALVPALADDADAVDGGVHAVQAREPVRAFAHRVEIDAMAAIGRDDRVIRGAQRRRHLTADEPARSGDQNLHDATSYALTEYEPRRRTAPKSSVLIGAKRFFEPE
jgi:hypothetical protein